MSKNVYKEITDAILAYDADGTVKATKKALSQGIGPNEIIDNAVGKTLTEVGGKFQKGELFLPQMVAIAACVTKALTDVIEPEIKKRNLKMKSKGVIVIGTVEGDVHDIGKSIVAAMLIADGFEVHDIGKDLVTDKFIEAAKKYNANIIGASAMLTETRPFQREIAIALKKAGLNEKVKYMLGGVAADEAWAEQCNAIFSFNCVSAVQDANKLMGVKK